MLRKLLLGSLLALVSTFAHAEGVPVLIYHRISDTLPPSANSITHKRFNEHLDMIQLLGYRTLTISQLVQSLKRGIVPSKTIVLTFDDGWKEHIDIAARGLQDRNMSATFYIITGAFTYPAYLNKEQVLALSSNPKFEIGAHSHTHFVEFEKDLQQLDARIMIGEMFMSKLILEQLLQKPVASFAWPYGFYKQDITPYLQMSGLSSAVHVNQKSANTSETNPLFVERINVNGNCTAEDLKQIIQTKTNKVC